jgi:hypothetical protein
MRGNPAEPCVKIIPYSGRGCQLQLCFSREKRSCENEGYLMQNSIERFAAGLNRNFGMYCYVELNVIDRSLWYDFEEHEFFPYKEHLQITERFIKLFGL